MYVCLCHAVSDQDIKQAVADGAQDLSAIQQCLGASTGCGACREFTEELIDKTLTESLSYAIA